MSLNYQHLLYFATAAREGSIARASQVLHLSQSTISGQIRALEKSLGTRLFERSGRSIRLTDTGREVYQRADHIFALGSELKSIAGGGPAGRFPRFRVGCVASLPKLVVCRLLRPVFAIGDKWQVACTSGDPDQLLPALMRHDLDLVIMDDRVNAWSGLKVISYPLAECGVTFFGTPELAQRYRRGFPTSLDGAPMLLPSADNALRRSLEQWFDHVGIRPRLRGEFDDSAVLKAVGAQGVGIFPVPTIAEDEACRQYDVTAIGSEETVRLSFQAISAEKKHRHPATVALLAAARKEDKEG